MEVAAAAGKCRKRLTTVRRQRTKEAEDFRLPVEENGYYTWLRRLQNHCKGADNLEKKKKKTMDGEFTGYERNSRP